MAQKIAYEPTEAEAFVLLTGTQEAAAAAGAAGGAIGGGTAGAVGGGQGGRAGARLTRAQTAVATLELPRDADQVRQQARAVIGEFGVVIDDPNAAGDGSVWGLVGSGAMNLAMALVRVGVEAGAGGGSRVEVRGTGREGLIKQKIGAKAVDRIVERLSQANVDQK